MLSVNKFDLSLVKSCSRTTSANRIKAVQNICGGVNAKQCKENARNAYMGCLADAVGIDKGTLELFRILSNMPEKIWHKFTSAGYEGVEGEKAAGTLVKLLQASALCLKYGFDYGSGYDEGYDEGFLKGESAESADADSVESAESVDARAVSEAEDVEVENKN